MSAKRKHTSTNEYLKYLKGELSHRERHSLERNLEADPFDMEAMEGLEMITPDEAEKDLLSLHYTLNRRLKRRRRIAFYSIAASVASLLIVGTVFINIYNFSPKSAEESIPNNEEFLHEEAATQDALTEAEAPREEEAVQEITPIQENPQILEEVQVLDEVQVLEEVQVSEEVQVPEEVSFQEEAQVEAAVTADEMVVMEAQPQRSQKKIRAKEAPSPTVTERVSGIVLSSEDMEPLPGASVMIKGSNKGSVTDTEGRFSIDADQQSETTVIASFIGMETTEFQVSGDEENQVVMQPDMTSLDEVVVVGYGVERETHATGAVQKVQIDKEEVIYSGAEPEGGLAAFKTYMEQNIRFPAGDTISKKEVVVLKFNVANNGTISRIQTLRSPGEAYTEEAIRLLEEGPVWNPARNESGVTDDDVRMRIVFKRQ